MATSADNPFPKSVDVPLGGAGLETDDDLKLGSRSAGSGTSFDDAPGLGTTGSQPSMGSGSDPWRGAASGGGYGSDDTDRSYDDGSTSTATASDLLQRLVQGAHDTIDRVAATLSPAAQRLQDGIGGPGGAQGALQGRVDDLRHTADEWTEGLRDTVRENPIAAVATAVAVGLLLARLTR